MPPLWYRDSRVRPLPPFLDRPRPSNFFSSIPSPMPSDVVREFGTHKHKKTPWTPVCPVNGDLDVSEEVRRRLHRDRIRRRGKRRSRASSFQFYEDPQDRLKPGDPPPQVCEAFLPASAFEPVPDPPTPPPAPASATTGAGAGSGSRARRRRRSSDEPITRRRPPRVRGSTRPWDRLPPTPSSSPSSSLYFLPRPGERERRRRRRRIRSDSSSDLPVFRRQGVRPEELEANIERRLEEGRRLMEELAANGLAVLPQVDHPQDNPLVQPVIIEPSGLDPNAPRFAWMHPQPQMPPQPPPRRPRFARRLQLRQTLPTVLEEVFVDHNLPVVRLEYHGSENSEDSLTSQMSQLSLG
ncbi:hypothetical protein N3K66_007893 [Trichothecium roseum]|uniref:Uncharacterized protein n=1 Tax=Trichothecium roseum TaxID=47278 RepID=A0ACC0US13_9HYPO|nr:hypothetical protein N3K66_007893 [Trichothecium roseum]